MSDWTLNGVALGVDKARLIERAVTSDFDGDGTLDAVAWTRARTDPPETQSSGELVLFAAHAAAGRVVARAPAFIPGGPSCHQVTNLAQTGPHTVTLDISATCTATLVARSPARGITVVAPAAERPEIVALKMAEPAPGELLDFTVDSTDRDGDGRDDVRLTASMKSGQEGDLVAADLIWLDRAAGPSRDASEPARSLSSVARPARTPGKHAAEQLASRIALARRLYATLCSESGTPRVFDADGAPFACPGIDDALRDLAAAQIHASLRERNALEASGALEQAQWFGAPMPETQRHELMHRIASSTLHRAVTEQPLSAKPPVPGRAPRWSPLMFDASGALLVQTTDGVTRFALPSTVGEAASVDKWSLGVGGGTDPIWAGMAFPCDRSEALLLVTGANGAPMPSEPTSLLAARPGSCVASGRPPTPRLTPLEWDGSHHAGLAGNALFGVETLANLGSPVPPGSPRSPDGKTAVLVTTDGLLVVRRPRSETWTADEPATLRDCVVANDAIAAACIRGDHAVLFTPAAEPEEPARASGRSRSRAARNAERR